MEDYSSQIAPIGVAEARKWGELVGAKEKHDKDMGILATAIVQGWTVVTLNVDHFKGRGAVVLDPSKRPPRLYVSQ